MPPIFTNKFSSLMDSDDEEDTPVHAVMEKTPVKSQESAQTLFDLPDEVQVNIYSFLPHRIRLIILNEKYPYKYYSEKLDRLPVSIESYYILHKYAASVYEMLHLLFTRVGVRWLGFRWRRSYGTIYDCLDWMNNVSELERRTNFIENVLSYKNIPVKRMILNAFKYYREIYSCDRSGRKIEKKQILDFEDKMIKLYAFVAGLDV